MTKGTSIYRIKDESAVYFLSITTIEWIDVFVRRSYKDLLVSSLQYCQDHKGLMIYSWVIMSNHIHLIVRAKDGTCLSSIIRDFKKFTSKKIINMIKTEPESRRIWMLRMMKKAAQQNAKKQTFQLWRNDNHPIVLYSNAVIDQKVDYIHQNPVVAGIVTKEEDYVYCSASSTNLLTLDVM